MSAQLEALPYRHVLTLPAMGSAVRIARETTEQVLMEWGIGRRHPNLTELRGWSVGGQPAMTEAARQLADEGRHLELAAIPADGSLVPDGTHPPIPVHCDLPAALTARR
ncbi:hypothetical protein [Streptomyces sp. NPDC006510]|uniref:hypothetical protein n=1 Tax=Streptomyces sp. NPDC006510 TaxID=3155600 RepID=UPI0033A3DA3E